LAEAPDEDKPALLETINRHLFEDEDEDAAAAADSDDKGKEKDKEDKAVTPTSAPKGKKGDDFRFDNVYEFLDCPIMRNLTVGGTLENS
jgi:hypothetical protein